jgi:hypothetical protein
MPVSRTALVPFCDLAAHDKVVRALDVTRFLQTQEGDQEWSNTRSKLRTGVRFAETEYWLRA